MPRRLKLMADYGCYPLWDYGEMGALYRNTNPAELPLTAETVAGLTAWSVWFETFLNLDDMTYSRETSPEEVAAFNGLGRQLWIALQRELGPGWQVVYFEDGEVLESVAPPGRGV